MGIFWLSNSAFGLYVALAEYKDYLETNYPSLRFYILLFSAKWFTSILLALGIALVGAMVHAVKCFTGSGNEVRKHVT